MATPTTWCYVYHTVLESMVEIANVILLSLRKKVPKSNFEYDFEGEPHQMRPNLKILRLSEIIMSQRKHIGREDGRST